MVGEIAQFECFSNGTMTWSFNEGLLPDNVKKLRTILSIGSVRRKNEGSYECQGYYGNGEKFESQALLKVRCKLSQSALPQNYNSAKTKFAITLLRHRQVKLFLYLTKYF